MSFFSLCARAALSAPLALAVSVLTAGCFPSEPSLPPDRPMATGSQPATSGVSGIRGSVSTARQVAAADEAGVEGASVRWLPHDEVPTDASYGAWRRRHADGRLGPDAQTCDPEGSFELRDVPSGDWRLAASAPGYFATLSSPVSVRNGRWSTGAALALDALEDRDLIEGVVVDPSGAPVAGATLHYEIRHRFSINGGDAQTDGEGRFRLVVRDEGVWTLTAFDPRGRLQPAEASDLRPGARDLVLQLGAAAAVDGDAP